MTEEEAKTKWCPMIQVVVGKTTGFSNRGDTGKINQFCIASECMWWVWDIRRNAQGEQLKWTHGHCGVTK